MNRGGLWVPATAMLIAAMAWVGCSDDDGDGGAAGSGTGGSAGSIADAGKGGGSGKGGGAGTDAGAGGQMDGGTGGSSPDASSGGTDGGVAGTGGAPTDGGGEDVETDAGDEGGTADGGDGGTSACKGDWTGGGACGTCLETSCCAVLATCGDTAGCIQCLSDPDPNSTACTPQNQDAAQALFDCAEASCNTECLGGAAPPPACDAPATSPSNGTCVLTGGTIACNPVTNAGCTGAGEACDLNANGDGYQCYASGNTQTLCQECNSSVGFCQAGMTCFGQCMKYCCSNADCGSGTCDTSAELQLPGDAGVCIAAGDGGVGDGGTDATTD